MNKYAIRVDGLTLVVYDPLGAPIWRVFSGVLADGIPEAMRQIRRHHVRVQEDAMRGIAR